MEGGQLVQVNVISAADVGKAACAGDVGETASIGGLEGKELGMAFGPSKNARTKMRPSPISTQVQAGMPRRGGATGVGETAGRAALQSGEYFLADGMGGEPDGPGVHPKSGRKREGNGVWEGQGGSDQRSCAEEEMSEEYDLVLEEWLGALAMAAFAARRPQAPLRVRSSSSSFYRFPEA